MADTLHDTATPSLLQKAIVILGGIVAPLFVIYVITKSPDSVKNKPVEPIDVIANIKPLAVVEVAPVRTNYVEMNGGEVVNQSCAACHTTGLMNAPKIGEATAWKARIALGLETLTKHATEGIRTMPARGGNPDLTDNEVASAVVFMTNQSGANFAEPMAAEKAIEVAQ